MIDRDSYFLYEMYQQVLFNEASLKPIFAPYIEHFLSRLNLIFAFSHNT